MEIRNDKLNMKKHWLRRLFEKIMILYLKPSLIDQLETASKSFSKFPVIFHSPGFRSSKV